MLSSLSQLVGVERGLAELQGATGSLQHDLMKLEIQLVEQLEVGSRREGMCTNVAGL